MVAWTLPNWRLHVPERFGFDTCVTTSGKNWRSKLNIGQSSGTSPNILYGIKNHNYRRFRTILEKYIFWGYHSPTFLETKSRQKFSNGFSFRKWRPVTFQNRIFENFLDFVSVKGGSRHDITDIPIFGFCFLFHFWISLDLTLWYIWFPLKDFLGWR